jgi:hypothetical protein
MEEITDNALQTILDLLEEWGVDPLLAAGLAGFLLILLLVLIFRKKPKSKFPGLTISLFQIAPLGRDAYLKIQNPERTVVLSQYKILGRNDIIIKNHLSGHRLETQKEYSILMEANSTARLEGNFSLELTYMDENGNVFEQRLFPGEQRVEKPKNRRGA